MSTAALIRKDRQMRSRVLPQALLNAAALPRCEVRI